MKALDNHPKVWGKSSQALRACGGSFLAYTLLLGEGFGQSYLLEWSGFGNGGGSGTAGEFSITSALGSFDREWGEADGFTLVGGFIGDALVIQEPGAPRLAIEWTQDTLTLRWSPVAAGSLLEFAETLSPPDWQVSPTGTLNPVSFPVRPGIRFYRVRTR
ncbi:MAG: hypothetical protein JNN07_14730 [Verrucomicrobiales bacterium]|nr:hypothetical protein [Verrucomicrobiales bacterium]